MSNTITAATERNRTSVAWFGIGVTFALFLMFTQARALGGLAGLLLVGEDSLLRPFIESLLGTVPLTRGGGHDGQIYFAIANDLDGDIVAPLINNPGIRFRRPVLPVLASMGGTLTGPTTLWLTVTWITLGFGATAAALRTLLGRLGARPRLALVLFIYPGFWIAVRLLTPDLVALGAALVGLVLVLDKRTTAGVVSFTVAALAKEAFLLVALGCGAWAFMRGDRKRGLLLAGIPTVVLVAWVAVILNRFDVEVVDGNFALPFQGIIRAQPFWATTPTSDQFYVVLTLVALASAVASLWIARSSLVRWLIIPFPLLGIISSEWIWRVGNGTLRSFSPVVLFMALALAERLSGRELTERL